MYYTIYKTVNLITRQEYIGQHITNNIDDSYIGSGSRLWNSIRKYGKQNFKKEILFVFDNFEDMNNKEIELVNEEWLNSEYSLNVVLGGIGYNTKDTLPVFDIRLGKFIRVRRKDYDVNNHTTLNKDKVLVKFIDDLSEVDWFFISSVEYALNKKLYKTPSSGKVSVLDSIDNLTKSVSLQERYETPDRYKSVFGGIVAEVNGKKQYVSKEKFKSDGLTCHTKGKVTVIEISTNKCFDISIDEYKINKHLYKTPTTGFFTGTHKATGKKIRIKVEDKLNYIDEYNFSTAGQVTVFSKIDNCFLNVSKEEYGLNKEKYNGMTSGMVIAYDTKSDKTKYSMIPKEIYDNKIHKLPKDIYLEFYLDGNLVSTYFGNKAGLHEFLLSKFNKKLNRSDSQKLFSEKEIIIENKVFKIVEIDWRIKYGIKKQ